MPHQDRCSKCQTVHIFCRCGINLPWFHQSSTARLSLTWSLSMQVFIFVISMIKDNSTQFSVSECGSTSMKGTPIRRSNFLHSSLCCLVTFTSRLLNLSMFSCSPVRNRRIRTHLLILKHVIMKVSVPASCAWARSFSASARLSPLFSSCRGWNKKIS